MAVEVGETKKMKKNSKIRGCKNTAIISDKTSN